MRFVSCTVALYTLFSILEPPCYQECGGDEVNVTDLEPTDGSAIRGAIAAGHSAFKR